ELPRGDRAQGRDESWNRAHGVLAHEVDRRPDRGEEEDDPEPLVLPLAQGVDRGGRRERGTQHVGEMPGARRGKPGQERRYGDSPARTSRPPATAARSSSPSPSPARGGRPAGSRGWGRRSPWGHG